jgi:hypothetical protein
LFFLVDVSAVHAFHLVGNVVAQASVPVKLFNVKDIHVDKLLSFYAVGFHA